MKILNDGVLIKEPKELQWECTRCGTQHSRPLLEGMSVLSDVMRCPYCEATWRLDVVVHHSDLWVKNKLYELMDQDEDAGREIYRQLDYEPYGLDGWGIELAALEMTSVGQEISRLDILLEDR